MAESTKDANAQWFQDAMSNMFKTGDSGVETSGSSTPEVSSGTDDFWLSLASPPRFAVTSPTSAA
jgi:hypothetical protein